MNNHSTRNACVAWLLLLLASSGLCQCRANLCDDIGDIKTADVEGLDLKYVLEGEGSPTIVFLTGFRTGMNLAWDKLFPEVTGISTILAYDRLNYGDSDPSEDGVPQTGAEIVRVLRLLLKELLLPPPYLLVAHSIGGLYAQLFARKYANETGGVIFIDSSHPDQRERFAEATKDRNIFLRAYYELVERVTWPFYSIVLSASEKQDTEVDFWIETEKQIKEAPAFPDIPVAVLSQSAGLIPCALFDPDSGPTEEVWQELQKDLAKLSPQGYQIVANTGHFVQNEDPGLVLSTIQNMTDKIRGAN